MKFLMRLPTRQDVVAHNVQETRIHPAKGHTAVWMIPPSIRFSDVPPSTRFSDVPPSTRFIGCPDIHTGQGPHSTGDDPKTGHANISEGFWWVAGKLSLLTWFKSCRLGSGCPSVGLSCFIFCPVPGVCLFLLGRQPENWPFTVFFFYTVFATENLQMLCIIARGISPHMCQSRLHRRSALARISSNPLTYGLFTQVSWYEVFGIHPAARHFLAMVLEYIRAMSTPQLRATLCSVH